MSTRTLKALVGALLGLMVVWAVVALVSRQGGRASPAGSDELAAFFAGVSAETAREVRFTGAQDTVWLRRGPDGWTVNGFAADSGAVAGFWTDLTVERPSGVVASNPANHARMGVSEDSARRVDLDVGGETRTLLVGKNGPRYGTAYVRLPDSDDVHLLEGQLRSHATRRLDDWRNKRVAAVDTALVQRIEVEREGESFQLVRADSAWASAADGSDVTAPARDVLIELANLRAAGFVETGDSLAQAPRSAAVLALSAAGDTLVALTLGGDDGDHWIRAAGDSVLYRIGSWRAGRIAPQREH